MTKPNGKTWMWAVGILIGLGMAAITSMNAFGVFQGETKKQVEHNHEEIVNMKPDVAKAVRHVDQDEVDTPYIKRDIAELKGDFKSFRNEQRKVNTEILQRLPTKDPQ